MKYLAPVLLALAACSTPLKITTAPTVLPAVQAPAPAPLNLSPVQWQVMTLDDLKRLIATKKPSDGFSIYVLDEDNYTALDLNLQEIKRYIEEQNQALIFYRNLENNRSEIGKSEQK